MKRFILHVLHGFIAIFRVFYSLSRHDHAVYRGKRSKDNVNNIQKREKMIDCHKEQSGKES